MDYAPLGKALVTSLAFSGIGIAIFILIFFLVSMAVPTVRKEIEEDQNVALGVVIGAMVLGISIIIAAAIHG